MNSTTTIVIGVILILFSVVNVIVCAVRIPDNPCPQVFQYRYDGNTGVYYGEAKLPYYGDGQLYLTVNASFLGLHDTKLSLHLVTPKEQLLQPGYVTYRLDFPYLDLIPKVTQIKFNGNIYCSGPQESTRYGDSVTNVWASIIDKIEVYSYDPNAQQGGGNFPQITLINPVSGSTNNRPAQSSHQYDDNNRFQPFPSTNTSPSTSVSHGSRNPSDVIGTNNKFQQQDEACGLANEAQNLIVGGVDTDINEFPWMVAIFKSMNGTYLFQCSGNLISKQHVLTVGHCLRFFKAVTLPKEDMLLVLGRNNLTHWATSGAILRTVVDVVVHPEYKQYTGHGDLAILKMNEPITITREVRPVCLWNGEPSLRRLVNKYGVVAGWGKESQSGSSVPKAKKIKMPIVSQETCLRANEGTFSTLTSDMTFCAGNMDGNGPCQGDGGSGMTIKMDGVYYLRGIVSILQVQTDDDNVMCDLSQYVVFCDVAKLKNWIHDTITNMK